MTGALVHVAVHAFVKCGLFLTAGIFLQRFGYTKVGQLTGTGKRMPGLMWCYTILSLALIGIPPAGGFISKWYLAEGALQSGTGIFAWLGPVVLLVSALLTAGYLLPVALRGFFPGVQEDDSLQELAGAGVNVNLQVFPIALLAALALLAGVLPNMLIEYTEKIAASVL